MLHKNRRICNTLVLRKIRQVFDIVFKIPKVPPPSNKSIRFPNDMLEEVEAAIRGTDCTFSAFVVAAVRMALDDLAEQERTKDDQ